MVLSKPVKRFILVISISALVFMVAGAAYFRSNDALLFALGVFLTSALNVLKMLMLDRTVHRVTELSDENAGKNILRLHYLVRYLLTGAVLTAIGVTAAAGLISLIVFYGAIAGILTLQVASFALKFMRL
jgi:hypothetical protein